MGLDLALLRSEMKTRRPIYAVAVEKSHGRHIKRGADFGEALGQRCAFEKAESRTGMEFDILHESVEHPLDEPTFPNPIEIDAVVADTLGGPQGYIPLFARPRR